jgi:hypothetical protein
LNNITQQTIQQSKLQRTNYLTLFKHLNPKTPTKAPAKMKGIFSVALLSALSLTASAVNINKARDYGSSSSVVPSYTVKTITSDGNTQYTQSVNGIVYLTINPNIAFLTHAEIDNENPPESATCTARDSMGNQVRAFGGPNFGDVDAVDFVPQDGKQIFSLICNPA